MLYPMIFKPLAVEKMWGGRKLETVFGKTLPPGKTIGESWELYDFPPGVIDHSDGWVSATLTNGPLAGKTLHELIERYQTELCGDVPLVGDWEHEGGQFPILIKYLDAREDLSVQVHPPAEYAHQHKDAHLKNEAWYVLQHDEGARILKGLRPGVTRGEFEQSIQDGSCEAKLQSIPAKDHECYYLPSGTVHALGAGCLVAEMQTPSDTTYRVYDFDRVDPSTGKPRQLHVEQALDCIDFSGHEPPHVPRRHEAGFFTTVTTLARAPQFTIEKVRMNEGVEQSIPYTEPVVWMVLAGELSIRVTNLPEPVVVKAGTTVLLPAEMFEPVVTATTDVIFLEVTFPGVML